MRIHPEDPDPNILQLPPVKEERARAVHESAFVYDATLFDPGFLKDEKGEIQSLVDGGLSGANLTFCGHMHNFARGMDSFFQHVKVIERNSERVRFCTTVRELEQCKKEGKVGIVAHFQDGKPIEDNLDYLRLFQRMGLRILQLTYNVQNFIGAGCCERNDTGLSYFGLQVVEECNHLGILVDLSHCNHATAWDAIRHSKRPVAFTHVGIHRLCPAHGRNKPDDLLKAVVDTGGVVGIVWFPPFVKRDPETHQVLQATVNDVLNQMEYAIDLLGADHVGIGTDLSDYNARTLEVPADSSIRWYRTLRPDVFGAGPIDRYDPFPLGLDSHALMMNVTRGLVKRGYSDDDIRKILGGNWLRLLKDIWGE